MSTAELKSREEIEKSFTSLLRAHRHQASQIETKAEVAERAREREVVESASTYTVENIVKGLAELQLEFSSSLESLAERMDDEARKVVELKRAIEIESRHLVELENLSVAAEALALLKQDHARKLAELERGSADNLAELDEEIAEQREDWARAASEREEAAKAFVAERDKQRSQAAEEHSYALAREDKLRADEQAGQKLALERELAESAASKQKDWSAREAALDARAEDITAMRAKVEGIETALEQAESEARAKAIASVKRDADHEADLLARETASNVEVFELKIETLEQRIADQGAEIEGLSGRLRDALAQAQKLASQALEGPRAEKKK
ncbi:hypothetical protein G6O69_05720 [Pseudenhygromyxa sp. WMMC2535]|uniref:hypothetical protein n=1 Tax=Pseudenhygromyxa sp. WMMC2535 TaxID=2712867 RepID=UPI001555B10B|nr:hypothetical protein [Pseudenhygromyxa sp. WMMC2535]NVB37320.1 hypothetical protein [Pseudenhygromyxa sp. WMMC2535]